MSNLSNSNKNTQSVHLKGSLIIYDFNEMTDDDLSDFSLILLYIVSAIEKLNSCSDQVTNSQKCIP